MAYEGCTSESMRERLNDDESAYFHHGYSRTSEWERSVEMQVNRAAGRLQSNWAEKSRMAPVCASTVQRSLLLAISVQCFTMENL